MATMRQTGRQTDRNLHELKNPKQGPGVVNVHTGELVQILCRVRVQLGKCGEIMQILCRIVYIKNQFRPILSGRISLLLELLHWLFMEGGLECVLHGIPQFGPDPLHHHPREPPPQMPAFPNG